MKEAIKFIDKIVPKSFSLVAFTRRFSSDILALVALVVLAIVVVAAIFAPLVVPQNPYDLSQLNILDGQLPPGAKGEGSYIHVLGTDDQGRDMLSAIVYGLRISLIVGVGTATVAFVVGTALGLLAAYYGGRTDTVIMRVVDLQLSFPAILVALLILALLGRGVVNIIFALILVRWAYYARIARGAALGECQREYIEAARSLALPSRRVLLRHLLPNCMPPLIVISSLEIATAITLEATLSFLGLGVAVTEPSLGLLISNGFRYMLSGQYWISFYPGIALLVVVVCINLISDRLRELLNPTFDVPGR